MSSSQDNISIPMSSIRRAGALIGAVILIVIIAVLVSLVFRTLSGKDPLAADINQKELQAVFLSNGQVYFGQLRAPGGDFYELRHVYYLASQLSPQSGRTPRQTLIKLGSEIHGPEDLMIINRSALLFVENLKPSGKVSQAIAHSGGP
jgi:hypothetical protein